MFGADISSIAQLMGEPDGPVAAHHWRFTLTTHLGVLSAQCTTARASRIRSFSEPVVRRLCHARLAV